MLLETRSGAAGLKPTVHFDAALVAPPWSQLATLGVSVRYYDLNHFLQQIVGPIL